MLGVIQDITSPMSNSNMVLLSTSKKKYRIKPVLKNSIKRFVMLKMGHFCSVPGGQEAGRTWWELLPLPAPKALVWFIKFLRNSPPSPCAPTQTAPTVPRHPWESSSSSSLAGALGKQGLVSPLSPSCTPSTPPAPCHSQPIRPNACSHILQSGRGAWVGVKPKWISVIALPTFHGSGSAQGERQNLCTSASRSLRRSSSL